MPKVFIDKKTVIGADDAQRWEDHVFNIENPHKTSWENLEGLPNTFPATPHASTHHQGGSDPLQHDLIAGAGSNSHQDIDAHIADLNNPHQTSWSNLQEKPSTFPADPHTHVEVDITDLDRVRWRNVYREGQQYEQNDMVRDGDWTMIANKQTTDTAAPRPQGEPYFLYSGADPTAQYTAKQQVFGNRYQWDDTGYLTSFRLYQIAGNRYTVYSVTDPEGAAQVDEILGFVAESTGWTEYGIQQRIIFANTTFDVVVIAQEPDTTPTTYVGNWEYQTPNNETVPTAGIAVHSAKSLSSLRVHKTDHDGTDRSADLANMGPGDTIRVNDKVWAIQAVVDNGTWVNFAIAPQEQAYPTGVVSEFTFETVTATPITVLEDVDYWLTNPPVGGSVQGFRGDLYSTITVNDTAYGVDIQVQAAYISPDWDVVAWSGGTSGGSSGGGGTPASDNWLFANNGADFLVAPVATGVGSIASGNSAEATGIDAVSIGDNSGATADYATALGSGAKASWANSTAVGQSAQANFTESVALGYGANSSADYAIAIGTDAYGGANYGIAIGNDAQALSLESIAVGHQAYTNDIDKILLLTDSAGLKVKNDGSLETSSDGGQNWSAISGGGGSGFWQANGSDIYYSGGNVGIGTTTPVAYLAVNYDGSPAGERIISWQVGASVRGGLSLFETNPSFAITDRDNNPLYSWTENNTTGQKHIWYTAQGTERMRIDADGNVLIGATAPIDPASYILQVDGNVVARNYGMPEATAATWGSYDDGAGIVMGRTGSGTWDNLISFRNQNVERMRVDASGNLGINTTSPGAKLGVLGSGAEPACIITGDTGPGLEIGTHSVNLQSDIALQANASIVGESSISHAVVDTNGYHRWMTGATNRRTGLAGATEQMRIDSTGLTIVGDITKTGSSGDFSVNSEGVLDAWEVIAGRGNGSVGLTINDGQGNANLTFNHYNGVPDISGSSARIVVGVDSAAGGSFTFETANNVTAGVSVNTTTVATMAANGDFTATGDVIANGSFSGNGSGLTNVDAATLSGEGLQSGGAGADTVVGRNSSGDIYARLFRSTYTNQTTIPAGAAMCYRTSTTDNYIRFCSDPAAVRTWLGISASGVKSIQRGYVNVSTIDTVITISAVNTAKCEVQFDRQYTMGSTFYRNEPVSDAPAVISSTQLKLRFSYSNSGSYIVRGWWTVIEYY